MADAVCPGIGMMPVPADFKYGEVLRRGRPRHEKWDRFSLKHPPMPAGKWAKIFSPFDALAGFDERIAEKEKVYELRRELCEDEKAELDRRLGVLHRLTRHRRGERAAPVAVSVEYFVPCGEALRRDAGAYRTAAGTVESLGNGSIRLRTESGGKTLRFRDILRIESEAGVFETPWDTGEP